MVTAEKAGKVIGVNQRRVFQIIEAGTVHFTETEGGTTLICIASMSNDAEDNPPRGSDPAYTGPQSPLSEGTTT